MVNLCCSWTDKVRQRELEWSRNLKGICEWQSAETSTSHSKPTQEQGQRLSKTIWFHISVLLASAPQTGAISPFLKEMEAHWLKKKLFVEVSYMYRKVGTSLAVQWLKHGLPTQVVRVQSLVRELRSHMSCSQKTKTWNRSSNVTNSAFGFRLGGGEGATFLVVPNPGSSATSRLHRAA